MRIAVLGIGKMGLPMARRLCLAGHEVHVWNRTRARAEALAADGATVHDTAAQAVAQVATTISLLENGKVVGDVLFGSHAAAAALPRGSLFMDMASIQPAEARDHARHLQALGVRHLDAPVSGGTGGAEQGTLAIMVGGDRVDFDAVTDLLKILGRPTYVGPHGAGQLAKLANQMIVGITIGAVAEALLLCEKGGADPAQVRQAISGGFADSTILQIHGQRMVQRDFTPHGSVAVQLKDMRNALVTADELAFDAPITQLLESLYDDAVDHGDGGLDHAGLLVELARRNRMK